MNSAESVLRVQQVTVWIVLVSALVTCCAGFAVYVLNGRAADLRREEARKQLENAQQAEAAEQLTDELATARQELEQAQARSTGLENRIATLGEQLAESQRAVDSSRKEVAFLSNRVRELEAAQEQPEAPPEAVEPTPALPAQWLNERARERFLATLEGKPTGGVVLIADSSNVAARSLTRELLGLLQAAGWQAESVEAVFQTPPQHSSIVAKSQGDLPDRAVALSLALAVVDLMQVPAPIQFNASQPDNYLGVIVVPPR